MQDSNISIKIEKRLSHDFVHFLSRQYNVFCVAVAREVDIAPCYTIVSDVLLGILFHLTHLDSQDEECDQVYLQLCRMYLSGTFDLECNTDEFYPIASTHNTIFVLHSIYCYYKRQMKEVSMTHEGSIVSMKREQSVRWFSYTTESIVTSYRDMMKSVISISEDQQDMKTRTFSEVVMYVQIQNVRLYERFLMEWLQLREINRALVGALERDVDKQKRNCEKGRESMVKTLHTRVPLSTLAQRSSPEFSFTPNDSYAYLFHPEQEHNKYPELMRLCERVQDDFMHKVKTNNMGSYSHEDFPSAIRWLFVDKDCKEIYEEMKPVDHEECVLALLFVDRILSRLGPWTMSGRGFMDTYYVNHKLTVRLDIKLY